jgi:hypothetical protein
MLTLGNSPLQALHSMRLRGQTRWKPAELETIARVFRVSVDELTGALEHV